MIRVRRHRFEGKRGAMFSDKTIKAVAWGTLSVSLYYAMFQYEDVILAFSIKPIWSVVLPVTVAFLFSIVHGNFTGYFWDALGVKPKSQTKK